MKRRLGKSGRTTGSSGPASRQNADGEKQAAMADERITAATLEESAAGKDTGGLSGSFAEGRVETTRGSKGLLASGVVLMAGAALLSKLIGVFQKIPLQNLAGDRVFGIYNAVYPFYQLAAVLATAGLPTAVSLLIAERLRKGNDPEGVRRTLYAALLLLGVTGIVAFGLMWSGAETTAGWIGDSDTAGAIRSVSFALLLSPFVAALRGYAQGLGRMGLSAASQVVEQMIRVGTMLLVLALSWSAGWEESTIAAGVMSGSAFGACAALVVLGLQSWRARRREKLSPQAGLLRAEMKKLAMIALPVALGAAVVPVLGVVDAFMVPRLLQEGGATEAESMSLFGIYSRAQPLVQLVVMVAGAAAAALVPGLVLARMRGAYSQLRVQLSFAERASWAIGAAAALGLVMLAEPLNRMLYQDSAGTFSFALVGCTALAGSVNAITAPVLQGLGAVRVPAVLLLVAALLKGVFNAVLVPLYGIEGAASAGIAALTAAALLGTLAVRFKAAEAGASLAGSWGARRGAGEGRRPLLGSAAAGTALALAVMAAALAVAERALGAALGGLPPRAAAAALALTCVAVGACAFGAAALRGGAVSARELRALPGGGVLAARLQRWRLMPRAREEE
ncbi:O-antigen/teichoic acid export membrane protein [Paenibacillus endophyticus]|uniref:O-antigen/teichoic acid export membrane protein n=1 Tax=Paenibacillus endophyticus TaxID=1294268 RepID=A0A7W5CF18_9BACL|nr:polysaccharide biosynthesis protein [Paenibacillus endophyticus]MBB3156075.1 O-antigen/teichoic acid export membrane protein [Paenibacillus endophyticus]